MELKVSFKFQHKVNWVNAFKRRDTLNKLNVGDEIVYDGKKYTIFWKYDNGDLELKEVGTYDVILINEKDLIKI